MTMTPLMEALYLAWVGGPNPDLWPSYLQNDPVKGHGFYSFCEGFHLAFRLCTECMAEELFGS